MNSIDETIKDRFQTQSSKWEHDSRQEYNISFLKEMINHAVVNDVIRIFYSHRANHIFSEDTFVEKLSDKIEESITVEIFTGEISSESILESNLLSRMTFYQIMGRKNIHIRRTDTNFTMTQEDKQHFIDFIVIGNSFLLIPKSESGEQEELISAVNDDISAQTLDKLFDNNWDLEHDEDLQAILTPTETE